MQGGSYDVTGYANLGDSADPSTFNFYRVQSDENVLMSLFFSDVGLATPVLIESVGSVRLIAQAGFQITLSNDFPLLNENRSGSINCGTSSCDWSFLVELDVKTNFVASLGFDFTLPVASRQFHIRSSVEYLGQYIEYKGTAKRVDRDLFNNRAGVPVATYILDGARKTKLVSALGPRLTMEVETARVGNFGVNLFLDGKVYWDLNNKEVNFGETKTGSTGTGGVSEFSIMPDEFLFQINAGFRIVWQGRI